MNIIKLLSEVIPLSDAPDIVFEGTKVLLQHNHAGGNAHLVVLKNAGGDVLGSFFLAPHRPVVIDKEPTDTLEVDAGVSDIFATKIAHMG